MPAMNASKLYLVLAASMLAGALVFGAHVAKAIDPVCPSNPGCDEEPSSVPAQPTDPAMPKCKKTVVVTGMHYPSQSCKQSSGAFNAGKMTNYHLTSKCNKPLKLFQVYGVKCQDAPIPGFPTGSVYTATACCI